MPPPKPQPAPGPAWFVHWSPGSIAAAVVAVIVALGGATGLRELIGSGEATRAAIAASEARIMAKIEEQRVADQKSRDEIQKAARVDSEKLQLAVNLMCALNDGPAHPSWPCDLRLTPPPLGQSSPRWVSSKPWPNSN